METKIGLIPKDWGIATAKELLSSEKGSLKTGPFGSQLKKAFFVAKGFKIYGQENVFRNDFSLGNRYIPKERFELLSSFELKPMDLIISRMGTVGFSAIVPDTIQPGIMDFHLLRLRINHSKFDTRFLLYAVRSEIIQNQINSLSVGTIMEGLSSRIIRMLIFPIPPLIEQRCIAKFFNDLDSKIELNQRMNKTLECIGQAVFKRWFVDFEFPNEEGKPYKSSGGELTNSKIGQIPKHWIPKNIRDFLTFEKGIEPGSKCYSAKASENTIRFIRVGDITTSEREEVFIPANLLQNNCCNEDDILLSLDATVGVVKVGMVGSFSGGIRKVYFREDRDVIKSYIYFLLKSKQVQNTILAYANGTTILHAGCSLDHIDLAFPDKKTLATFSKISDPIFMRIVNNLKENNTLEQIRDSLLPKLMSGKIRVLIDNKMEKQ